MKKLQYNEVLIHPHDHKNLKDWQRIFNLLDKRLNIREINSFLELGAGMGNLGYFILKRNSFCQVICEDINPKYLKIINQRDNKIKTILHDINQPLPFKDGSFDLVSCVGTLHYACARNPERILKEIVRLSKKYILVDFFPKYSFSALLERIFRPHYNPRRYSLIQVSKLLRKLNLKEVAKIGTRTIFPKLFPFLGKTILFLFKKQ